MAQTQVAPDLGTALSRSVAAEVRAWRGRLAVTQGRVAEILGLSQPQVSQRLSGKVPFSLDEIGLLAAAWDLDPAELISPMPLRRPARRVNNAQSRRTRSARHAAPRRGRRGRPDGAVAAGHVATLAVARG